MNEPNYVIWMIHLKLICPFRQFFPFVGWTSINTKTHFCTNVLAVFQIVANFLGNILKTHGILFGNTILTQDLYYLRKVFSLYVVICFKKNFSQSRLTHRVAFQVILVKAVETVSILRSVHKSCHRFWFWRWDIYILDSVNIL